MTTITRRALTTLFLILPIINGCSNMKIQDYAKNTPTLDLFDYFEGNTRGWGMFQDRNGNLKRQFVVDLKGTINEDGDLVLEEDFIWNDGEKTRRVWTISQGNNKNYIGKADDVEGQAKGISVGNAFHWQYVLKLPVGDKTYKVSFDDWIFLQPDGVLLNRAKMSKFGITLGEVIISFKK